MPKITTKLVSSVKASRKSQFIRDSQLIGFGVKVSPKRRVSYIVEGRIRGKGTRRITLGQYPALSVIEARTLAQTKLGLMHQGIDPVEQKRKDDYRQTALSITVRDMFESYMKARPLKPKTRSDYRNTFNLIFAEWHDLPVREITRRMAEEKFVETRDKRGKATAVKSLRIISAVFNFSLAEEVDGERLIQVNPADVIKQKRYDRRIKGRVRHLTESEITKLISFYHKEMDWHETPKHGVTDQGINYVMLLLSSGLRRSEAFKLKWDDVDWSKGQLVIHDTKNSSDHYVPISTFIGMALKQQRASLNKDKSSKRSQSMWVFPARVGDGHMTEPKSQLARICEVTGVEFSFHDLRRTFATHAEINGVSFDLIQKALNHKPKSVTDSYIISQVGILRPVFEAVADGYHTYYNPDWKYELEVDKAFQDDADAGLIAEQKPIVFPDLTKVDD
jgi:integrase